MVRQAALSHMSSLIERPFRYIGLFYGFYDGYAEHGAAMLVGVSSTLNLDSDAIDEETQ